MTTIAERVAAFTAAHGTPATVSRAGGGTSADYDPLTNASSAGDAPGASFTTDVFEDEPEDDDFRDASGAALIVRDPVILLIPNSDAVSFEPAAGMTVAYLGKPYSIAKARPYVFDGVPQFWRVVGGI